MNKLAVAVVLLSTMAAGTMARADEPHFPTQVFDATYDMKSPYGDSTMRMASDGKGHLRTEMNSKTGKTITLTDYLGKKQTTAIESQKMIMTVNLPPDNKKPITDEASAKKAGAKLLGEKKMDGHPCHGFEASTDKATVQTWVGDDTHYLVHSETTLPNGKQVMSLKAWSDKAPADLLTMPTGYKVIKMPGQ